MIKAICFDLDGMYFEASGFQLFKDALIRLGAKMEDINLYLHGDSMKAFKRGEIDEDDYWSSVIKSLGIDITTAAIKELLVKNYKLNSEVHSLVLKAKEAGYKTCICSNNFITRVRGLNDKFGFLDHFDVSVFSYEVKDLKPSPVIFKELLLRTAVKPEELIYADDNADKLSGAQTLGINTFTFSSIDQFKEELVKLGVAL
ncbi:MAG TPA: HAD-IA family hydrolase [Candidatus Limnocylindria bacterium]|nr:HAD-IA family hydrolase [Candidatus Limnocylindria bacterium]